MARKPENFAQAVVDNNTAQLAGLRQLLESDAARTFSEEDKKALEGLA